MAIGAMEKRPRRGLEGSGKELGGSGIVESVVSSRTAALGGLAVGTARSLLGKWRGGGGCGTQQGGRGPETVPSPELAPGGVRGRKLGSPLAPVPRDPHSGHPARPSPTSPLSGTHGSAELRAGALS